MNKVRFGIIGAGGIAARRTIPGLLLSEKAELTALMGPNLQRTEALRERFGAEYAFDSEREMLERSDIDAVYIASPVVYHAAQAKLCADYGKHILLEKPIAMTATEAEEVLSYCERKNVKVAAGLMMRFGTHANNMRRAVAAGRLGQLVSGYSRFTCWLPTESGNWRIHSERAGGGSMMDLGVHTIDLFEYITDLRVTEVASMNDTLTFDYDVEDSSTIILRMENGAQCVVQTNYNVPDEEACYRFELFGTRGSLIAENITGQEDTGSCKALFLDGNKDYNAQQDGTVNAGTELSGSFGNLYTREIDSFCGSILTGAPLEVPAAQALHVQRVMEAAYKSSWDRTIESVR